MGLTLVVGEVRVSRCHRAKIYSALSDGVLVGTCAKCHAPVMRMNPRTGKSEWLNGVSPWSTEDAAERASRPEDKP